MFWVVGLRIAEGAGSYPDGMSAAFGMDDGGLGVDTNEAFVHSAREVGGVGIRDRPEGSDDGVAPGDA